MEDNPKILKILSIDGGGIKGLYSAKILDIFEKHYKVKVSDCFDLICGTSTGGLIALALSIEKNAEEIVNIYKDKANIIFPKNPLINLKQLFCKGKYSNDGLNEVLNEIFDNNRLEDAKTSLCIPTVDLNNCKPWVFKTNHNRCYTRDPQSLMREVALATTAAPTYFPIAKLSNFSNDFVDGGLWANNPSLVGITEALKCFVGKNGGYDSFNILSIASIEENVAKPVSKGKNSSYFSWGIGAGLISTILQIQSKSHHHFSEILCDSLPLNPSPKYIRIPSPSLSAMQAKIIKMDSNRKEVLATLESLGSDKGYEFCDNSNFNLSVFFKCKKEEACVS